MGVSTIRGYLFGGPHIKDCNILGFIFGSPYFGKLPYVEFAGVPGPPCPNPFLREPSFVYRGYQA